MAKLIYSGSAAQFATSLSMQGVFIKYELPAPFVFPKGTTVSVQDLINDNVRMGVIYESSESNASAIIMSASPFRFLAHVDALRSDRAAFVEIVEESAEDNAALSVSFFVPLFRGNGRKGASTDVTSFELSGSGTFSIWAVDTPFMSKDSMPFKYRQRTVDAGDSQRIATEAETLYIPNTEFKLSVTGVNASVQTAEDFLALYGDSQITNITPYNQTNYFAVAASQLTDVQLTAGGGEVVYFYTDKQ